MKLLRRGEIQSYWFDSLVSTCHECGTQVEFTPYDLDKHTHGWFGSYLTWYCKNPTCMTTKIRVLKKPWYREVFDDLYAAEVAKNLTNSSE